MVKPAALSRDDVMRILDEVKDPEIPVISVVELGVVRDVTVDGGRVSVTITPTYSGCPAMREMEQDIVSALERHGATEVTVSTVHAPAWTTDWISAAAKEKLRGFGIAPPGPAEQGGLVTLTRRREPAACPYCGSRNTVLKSEFGSTACKAIHYCNGCTQPFDEFKAF